MPRSTPPRSLHGHVIHELGKRIVSGQIAPGDLLPREETLAEQMSVSRTALREAMKVLTAKGLIESRPKVGTRVRDPRYWQQLDADVLAWRCENLPTDDFIEKLIEMREVIEPAASAAAARHCDADQLARLETAYAAMADAADHEAWSAADLDFHEAILAATNNELMMSLFAVIETALGTFFVLSARTAAGQFKYSLPHHELVLEAIRRRRPEAARRAMQRLVDDSRANMAQRKHGRKNA
ncbi:MAG TPA: FadR/GntR family transcriptional regulator [Rhodanobacteraceae bacterium]